MGLSIEQAEKLLDDLATQEELLCKRADDASGYTRSGNESIRTSNAKTHEQHAKEYRQILRYLAEYRLMQADYEARLKADMMAILRELKNELIDVSWNIDMYDSDLDFECCYLNDIDVIIQQKINSLEAESEGE